MCVFHPPPALKYRILAALQCCFFSSFLSQASSSEDQCSIAQVGTLCNLFKKWDLTNAPLTGSDVPPACAGFLLLGLYPLQNLQHLFMYSLQSVTATADL